MGTLLSKPWIPQLWNVCQTGSRALLQLKNAMMSQIHAIMQLFPNNPTSESMQKCLSYFTSYISYTFS